MLKSKKSERTIEKVIDLINNDTKLRTRHEIPDDFNHLISRRLFTKPEIISVR